MSIKDGLSGKTVVTKYKVYEFVVNEYHPYPYRIDDGLPIPPGNYMMMKRDDIGSLIDDVRRASAEGEQ